MDLKSKIIQSPIESSLKARLLERLDQLNPQQKAKLEQALENPSAPHEEALSKIKRSEKNICRDIRRDAEKFDQKN